MQPKQAVLSLNDLATIEIDISVPESDIAASNPEARRKSRLVATFDFFPGEEFEVTLKEFTAEADPTTQTFTATLTMPRPEDKSILPGMTATVTSFTPQEFLGEDADGFPVPLDAVPVQVSEDGTENWFVWKMKDTGNGTFTVHRTEIVVGEVAGNTIVVREGLARGDRIALAGVNILTEGREVRLLESRSDPRNSNAGSGGTAANNAGSPAVAGE